MSLIDVADIPWLRNTRSAYSNREHDVNKPLTWSAAVIRSLITTPSAVRLETRSMPSHGGGIGTVRPRLTASTLVRNVVRQGKITVEGDSKGNDFV